jgi:hypothetical protein
MQGCERYFWSAREREKHEQVHERNTEAGRKLEALDKGAFIDRDTRVSCSGGPNSVPVKNKKKTRC